MSGACSYIGYGVLLLALLVYPLFLRVDDIAQDFWLMDDQVRDWERVQVPFAGLPRVGTERTGGGHHLGPAYYWWLWLTRVSIGPLCDNLPHAAGISVSALCSLSLFLLGAALYADGVPLALVLGVGLLLATCPYEAALSRAGWNPSFSYALVNFSLAGFVRWRRRLVGPRIALLCALAWMAVQAHLGAVAWAAALATLVVADGWTHGRSNVVRAVAILLAVVAALQVPWLVEGYRAPGLEPARTLLGASLETALARPSTLVSLSGVRFVLGAGAGLLFAATPISAGLGGAVIALSLVASFAHGIADRARAQLAAAAILPACFAGAAFTLVQQELQSYWLIPILGTIAFACVLGWQRICAAAPGSWMRWSALGAPLVVAVLSQPTRWGAYAVDHRYPSYAAVVRGSRFLVDHRLRVRDVVGPADDRRPTRTSPLTLWLGGELFPESSSVARIDSVGRVTILQSD